MLVGAMKPFEKKTGDVVIKEGDPGDYFYVVESGTYSAHVKGKEVKKYASGTFFGELALAYNKPRAASVKCTSPGRVLALAASGA